MAKLELTASAARSYVVAYLKIVQYETLEEELGGPVPSESGRLIFDSAPRAG
jgi:hypothetical protein